jgi:hypothetical protein
VPPGGGAWGLATASARASKRQRLFRKRLAVFEFESKSLDDRPSPVAMSGQSESSPIKPRVQSLCFTVGVRAALSEFDGWPIGRVRPSNASPSPIGRSSREPRADRAEIPIETGELCRNCFYFRPFPADRPVLGCGARDAESARQGHLAKLWRDALRQNK